MAGETSRAQTGGAPSPLSAETSGTVARDSGGTYTVIGATGDQEEVLRTQIRRMRPDVLPARVVFVPHWKYLDNARIFHLHVATGYASVMFTHLPSRTVFIDNDRYLGEKWLCYWIAHELGHLKTNSVKEQDAERAAREFRKRFGRRM